MKFIDIVKEKTGTFKITKKDDYLFFLNNYSGNLNIEIKTPGVYVDIFGLYVGKKDQRFELNTIQHHNAPDAISNLLVKGVFYDESKFIYEGLIRIDKGAQKSHAYQKNQNLIMSPKCFVDSRPFLEILANDVFCTHGSTTGRLDNEQLYYVKSRGLSQKKAEDLLIDGFLQDVTNRIRNKVPFFQLS